MIPGSAGSPARPPVEEYDTGLFDLDGVVYIGADPVPSAVAALERARAAGMRVAFVTNNASRTPGAVAAHLSRLGVPAGPHDVVTSAQAAARLVAERVPAGSPVLVCGGMGLRHALHEHGLRPVSTAAAAPVAVVQGYTRGIDHGLLAEGALAVEAGAVYVAANGDTTLPSARGPIPGNGALIQVISKATGRAPTVVGKPEPPMHREAMLRTGARRPLVVGDRLDTDIEGATRGGVDSLLVLTGVTHPADLLTAPPKHRPTLIAADLDGLLVPHAPAEATAGTATCRNWRVTYTNDTFEITGSGNPFDALRALCAAAWTSPKQPTPETSRKAVAQLNL